MREQAEQAFAFHLMKRDYKPAMIGWAVEVLCAGGGGEATTLLAGADHEDEASVLALFRKAAKEQGILLPGQGEEFPGLERWICVQLMAGKMGPQEGLSFLNWIWRESSFDERFARWLYLAESIMLLEEEICGGLEPFEEMTLETVDETILREAQAVVGSGSGDSDGVLPSRCLVG